MQVYQTNEDEGILECLMSWGSNVSHCSPDIPFFLSMKLRAGVPDQ